MRPLHVYIACGVALLASGVHAGPTPQRAAQCVAALKLRADALASRLEREPQTEPELVRVLEHGIAFIGDAYLHGMRDKDKAEAMLRAAEQAQANLPPAQMAQRQAGCQTEAERLLAEAGPMGRMIVSHQAKKRLTRIKEKQKSLAAAT